jgi:hypothetical protein
VYAVIGVNSAAQNLLFAPLFVQEMVLAAWMIARGFRPAAGPTTSARGDGMPRAHAPARKRTEMSSPRAV